MYQCRHFAIHELVPPNVYRERGEKAWELMAVSQLLTIDALRDEYGPMTINDYIFGGVRQWSGLRTPDSPFYSPYSQHTFGRATDSIFHDISAEEVREDILNNPNKFPYIMSVELGTDWLHCDSRNCHRIKTYTP